MLHYIGFFTNLNSEHKRGVSPASVTKMKYVATKLAEAYEGDVHIYSCAVAERGRFSFYKKEKYGLAPNITVEESASFSGNFVLLRFLKLLFAHLQLLKFLIFDISNNDIVVIYHSMFYKKDIQLAKCLRRLNIIMEIEELYNAAWMKKCYQKEINYLAQFKAYIYVNNIMGDYLEFNKPNAVCYGNYNISENFHERNTFETLLYAGGLGSEGSDVDLAINVMNYLPNNYRLFIAGSGSKESIAYVKKQIKDKENIFYKGFLTGTEYEELLNDAELGLCTRVLPNSQSVFTFPSKILVYLSHGIIPICPNLDCISESSVKKVVITYESNTPQDVARSILEAKNRTGISDILVELDSNFKKELSCLLNYVINN